eukprot:gene1285-738_t
MDGSRNSRGRDGAGALASPSGLREDYGPDTWSSFLAAERDRLQRRTAQGGSGAFIKKEENNSHAADGSSGRPLTVPEMLKTLEEVIAAQNSVCRLTADAVKSLRRNEERQRCAAASYHPQAALVENTPCMDVFYNLLAVSRDKWRALLNDRLSKVTALKPGLPSPKIPNASLPTVSELFEVLVEGLNAPQTLRLIEKDILYGGVPSSGLEAFGLHSVFKTQIRALAQFDTLSPSVQCLRKYFADLRPQVLTSSINASHMQSSIETYEDHLDTFLRSGDYPEALAAVLRSGVHPSMRRLYYARALQIPLVVTDGRPLFVEQGDFQVNHFPRGSLLAHLTFATKKTRERIKRRMTHSPSGTHSAMVLQPLIKQDAQSFVGDSEKYFVYLEDVEVLGTALMVDIGVSDTKLKEALAQMGRPGTAINSYRCSDSETSSGGSGGSSNKKLQTILQAVLPSSATLLMAPLCNVTGDTVEQYELMSGMFSQLWKRLLGPTPELAQCCWIFERLTEEFALPAVAKALRVLQHPPLLLALQWMLTGFSELLVPSEALGLWDLLLAYHIREMAHRSPLSGLVAGNPPWGQGASASTSSQPADGTAGGDGGFVPCALWLLPIMAAAVFVFRAPLVERAETREQLLQVFAVSHHLKARPLLQQLLFCAS